MIVRIATERSYRAPNGCLIGLVALDSALAHNAAPDHVRNAYVALLDAARGTRSTSTRHPKPTSSCSRLNWHSDPKTSYWSSPGLPRRAVVPTDRSTGCSSVAERAAKVYVALSMETTHVHSGHVAPQPRPGLRQRTVALLSSAVSAVLGLLPHVLHHVGPLAGAALLAGTAGTLLFGAIGLVAAVPFLLRVHRRCGNWRVPAALLALFAVMFSISAFVIGPAITGSDDASSNQSSPSESAPTLPEGHDAHHQ